METLLHPSCYTNSAIFEAEQGNLFSSGWIFVGFRSSLIKPDDWITAKVGPLSVTIQNFNGEIKAYHNVCSHRFNIMRTTECGHGSLQCPYHGWIYGEDGLPSAIPSRPRFSNLDENKVRELALRRFTIDFCGELIFVRLNADGLSLQEYVGERWDVLEKFASSLGAPIAHNRILIQANWKIVVENGLEGYHSSFIHPQTFGKMRSNRFELTVKGRVSSYEEFISEAFMSRWKPIARYFSSRPILMDNYVIHSLFPTFSIDTIRGASFAVNVVKPTGVDSCILDSYLFATKLEDSAAQDHAVVKAYNHLIYELGPTVINEDKAVCETVYQGILEARNPGLLSEEEIRIASFHKHYLEAMSPAKLKFSLECP